MKDPESLRDSAAEDLAGGGVDRRFRRVFLIVLDSLGVGAMPDADAFGDAGAHTLDHICEAAGAPDAPRLLSLGLGNIEGVDRFPAAVVPEAAFGRMSEASAGKDTTTGHWEMAGVPLDRAFPTFPDGFDDALLGEIAERCGLDGWLCNEPASGTEVIERLGPESVATGRPIVYTSADSVFQVAAHEEHFGLQRLYEVCEVARELTVEMGLARVIARPFVDSEQGAEPGARTRFARTYNRRDYSLTPPRPTVLDALKEAGVPVVGIGKIEDIFAGLGLTRAIHTEGNAHGMAHTRRSVKDLAGGLVFVNLVDFDMLYGHRRDPAGYRTAIEEFDRALGELEHDRRDDDIFILTADHGNDPTKSEHTDHTREYVPLIVYGTQLTGGVALGTRSTFADIGATVADVFGVAYDGAGTSFLADVVA
ncbi:MAG: phosphopentomutase [Planctomycetota bacterium]